MADKLAQLRTIIQESLRVQRGSAEQVRYIDTGTVLPDVSARQNHVIFARRGCGKTLLLHYSSRNLPKGTRAVYLNCEDFKRHSFPNVLIEILDALFAELEKNLSGWFGKKKKSKDIIGSIRSQLKKLRESDDVMESSIKSTSSMESGVSAGVEVSAIAKPIKLKTSAALSDKTKDEIEKTYKIRTEKLRELDNWLPRLKQQVREFFDLSTTVKSVYLQIDDLYHLKRNDQPFVIDYVHRLCKDVNLFFKVATLRHASVLYVDRDSQPIGAQERHDFQPINVDYSFGDFRKTRDQNKLI